jgi:prophage antirepressor-like protein
MDAKAPARVNARGMDPTLSGGRLMTDLTPIQAFSFEDHDVRVLLINGEPWWVASDVCKALTIVDVSDAVQRLDQQYRCQTPVLAADGKRYQTWVINEAGLYELIFRSDKPAARRFQRWTFSEVLPTIRQTGSYGLASLSPRQIAEMVIAESDRADKALERADLAEDRLAEVEPLAESYEKYMDTTGLMSVGAVAKTLGVGPNKLFVFLRHHAVLIGTAGERFNTPYQRHIQRGRVTVKLGVRQDRDGNDVATYTTMFTPKGLEYVSQLLAEYGRP